MAGAIIRTADLPDFFARVKVALRELGWNQGVLATQASLSPSTISRWASGRTPPSGDAFAKIVSALGCRAGWLLTGEGNVWEEGKSDLAAPQLTTRETGIMGTVARFVCTYNLEHKLDLPEKLLDQIIHHLFIESCNNGFDEKIAISILKFGQMTPNSEEDS